MGEVIAEEMAEVKGMAAEGRKEAAGLGKFLPKMALSVMLVESDDSTRQMVSALLRKCSYRVVAAVPDGLKAWEILKEKANSIDLILTEVDLPSISGFALLTLIMEHEICKNIPVIMMSSQDSISTVYKCMMRGAADYLVKPIRENELRNLWLHVWRRQSAIVGGNESQDESVGQQKIEVISENDTASNNASDNMDSVERNDEPAEKGSDGQCSCTKPELQAENARVRNMQELPLMMMGKSVLTESEKGEAHAKFNLKRQRHETKTGGSGEGSCDNADITNMSEGVEAQRQRRDATVSSEACDAAADSSRQAIDFMTTFDNHNFFSIIGTNNADSHAGLDLTLRTHPNLVENHVTQETPNLWHPNASAFSRYSFRSSNLPDSTSAGVSNQKKELQTGFEKLLSNAITGANSDTPSSSLTVTMAQSKQSEIPACPKPRSILTPAQVKGVWLDNRCAGHHSALPSNLSPQATGPPGMSPSSSNQQEHVPDAKDSANQDTQNLSRLSSFEDRRHFSFFTDQSESSSLCNSVRNHPNSAGYGNGCASNGNVNASLESSKEDKPVNPSGDSHRSILRKAALNKFRLKRKDRCFEKKVRYESRKKLAEQRPRIKGQFVRQMQSGNQPKETHHLGQELLG